MALTPGGGRSSSTRPRPSTPPTGRPRPPRNGGKLVWPRSASVSVVRLGLLIGGLVIIVDLLTQVITQHSLNPEDVAQWQLVDFVVNLALFFLLGVLVVRDTGLLYSGVVAGVLASLLDAIVVAAAAIMAPTATPIVEVRDTFAENVAIGTVFAGLAGVVYGVVQRWSGGRRSR